MTRSTPISDDLGDELERLARSASRAAVRLRRLSASTLNPDLLSLSGRFHALACELADRAAGYEPRPFDPCRPFDPDRPVIEVDRGDGPDPARVGWAAEGFREFPVAALGPNADVGRALAARGVADLGGLSDLTDHLTGGELAAWLDVRASSAAALVEDLDAFRAAYFAGLGRGGDSPTASRARACPDCGGTGRVPGRGGCPSCAADRPEPSPLPEETTR